MWRSLYTVLFTLLLPLLLVRLWWRGKANPAYRLRVAERLGAWKLEPAKKRLWVHAVSVGEVNAAVPLIMRLQQDWPEYRILVTTMTPTGADQVVRSFGTTVDHRYLPYDQPWFVGRAFRAAMPQAIIIMETEIWPNLIYRADSLDIPVIYLNMRLSRKSFGGYQRIRALVAPPLRKVKVIGAQSEQDARRVQALGAEFGILNVTGNIKFDAVVPEDVCQRGSELRRKLGDSRLVWIAASTHDGEDEQVLAAHQKVLESHPRALLILVPRHPERFEEVFQLASREFSVQRRSSVTKVKTDCQIYLGDSMGEMMEYFAACDLAFVAGSLEPVGGHNILEPWLLDKPVIVGPHMFNFLRITELGLEHNALVQVSSAAELGEAVIALANSPARRQRMIASASQLLSQNRGALDRSIELLSDYLYSDTTWSG